MFKRDLVACKQHLHCTHLSIDSHCQFSKCTPPTTDSPRRLRHLSTELPHLPRS